MALHRIVSPDGQACIVASPIVPHTRRLPALDVLVDATVDAEASFVVTQRGRAEPIAFGPFAGVRLDVTGYVRPYRPVERRVYVAVSDGRFVYCVTYIATVDHFDEHFRMFSRVLAALQPSAATFVEPPSVPTENPFAD